MARGTRKADGASPSHSSRKRPGAATGGHAHGHMHARKSSMSKHGAGATGSRTSMGSKPSRKI